MNLVYQFLAAVIRWLLAAVFGALVVRGVIGADLAAKLGVHLDGASMTIASALLGLVVPLVWSWWNKIKHKVEVKTALEMPVGTTPARLEDAMDQKTVTEKVKEAVQ